MVYNKWIKPRTNDWVREKKHISNHVVFQQPYYSNEGRIYDENKKEVILKNVDWVITSDDKDSLAVFTRNGRALNAKYNNLFNNE